MEYLGFFIICFLCCSLINCEQLVKINQGLIKGTTMRTRNGREISIFLGIPYAEPPIGKLRYNYIFKLYFLRKKILFYQNKILNYFKKIEIYTYF